MLPNIVYNNGMNERSQALDLRKWANKIRKERKQEDFFREFDAFILTVFRIIALFFGVDIAEDDDVLRKKNDLFRKKKNACFAPSHATVRCLPTFCHTLPFCRYSLHS